MESQNQKQVWDAIAPEWYEFKVGKPSPFVEEFLGKQKKGSKILDLGCGAGRHFYKTEAEIYAVDFSDEMIKYAKLHAKKLKIKNVNFFVAEAWKLPFEDNLFDVVLLISVMHCIQTKEHRQQTLKEVFRVLKSGGKVWLSNWNKESSRFKNKNKEDIVKWRDKGERFYYFYTEKELQKEIEKAGFKILSQKSKTSNEMTHHSISFLLEKP